jgi:hypothetical protein
MTRYERSREFQSSAAASSAVEINTTAESDAGQGADQFEMDSRRDWLVVVVARGRPRRRR